mgnify:CR=1
MTSRRWMIEASDGYRSQTFGTQAEVIAYLRHIEDQPPAYPDLAVTRAARLWIELADGTRYAVVGL